MALEYTIVPVTPYQQNCSIIRCTDTGKAAIVDPGGDDDVTFIPGHGPVSTFGRERRNNPFVGDRAVAMQPGVQAG